MIDKEVYEYGQSIGIKNLRLQSGKAARITLERTGNVYLEKIDDSLLIYILKDYAFAPIAVFLEALTLCHAQEIYPFLVRPVFNFNNGLGFLIKHHESDCTVSNINRALVLLKQLHDRLSTVKS